MTPLVDHPTIVPTPPALRTSKRKRPVVKYYDSDASDEEAEDSLDDFSKDEVQPSNKVR